MAPICLRIAVRAKRLVLAVGSCVILGSASCSVSHVPKLDPIESHALPDLRRAGALSLVNAQPDKATRDLGSAGFGTLQGELHGWTDSAIALLTAELESAGLAVRPDAPKSLRVAVLEAELGVSGIDFVASIAKCRVRMRVETGNGYSQDYDSENNALSPPGACDTALSEVTERVLEDPRIAAYLGE